MRYSILMAISLFLLLVAGTAAAQPTNDSLPPNDTTKIISTPGLMVEAYYVDRPLDSSKTQNPTAALFKSILVPGWGQLGNGNYLKAGIVIATETYLIANLVRYAHRTADAKKAFDTAPDDITKGVLYTKYRRDKDDRNFYSWMTGVTIFISMFDAYVDAHLARFPKYPKGLSFDAGADEKSDFGVRISYNF